MMIIIKNVLYSTPIIKLKTNSTNFSDIILYYNITFVTKFNCTFKNTVNTKLLDK